jgi:nucleoside-diphosphate-sugar epimerase
MRVFLAGGTGAIGRPLVLRLVAGGHEVGVLARSKRSAAAVVDLGAEAVEGDALNALSLGYAVRTFRPEVIINQLTSLPKHLLNPWHWQRHAKLTNRLRTDATEVLVAAAAEVGAERIISQSISFAQQPGESRRVEADPLFMEASGRHRKMVQAVAACESATMGAAELEAVVLRYGAFYGPGTYFAAGAAYPRMLDRHLFPLVGEGRGIWALLHIHDAVDATVRAMTGPPGIYNICDDSPVAAAELIPWMAYALGAKVPRTMPRFLFGVGPATVFRYLIDEQPAVSSERARQALRWQPRHPDWRHELARVLRGEPLV